MIDSVTAFSDFPIRLCSYGGVLLLALGTIAGMIGLLLLPTVRAAIFLLAAMLGLTGIQLLALGIVGEYVWRALEQSRGRPIYVIEAIAGRAVPERAAVE